MCNGESYIANMKKYLLNAIMCFVVELKIVSR